ncbi:MAG: ArnT family glycosyltransferase [Anaerolineae bacterium]
MDADRFPAPVSFPWKRDIILILLASLVCRAVTAIPFRSPGYMDAFYYYVNAERIAAGQGLTEPFIWNYLAPSLQLPAPAFQYWMPFTSFLIVPFFALLGIGFRAAQIPFILISSLLPALTYLISLHLAPRRRTAWFSAALTLLAPAYAKFWATTDNFTPFGLWGSLALLCGWRAILTQRIRWALLAGLCTGLAHLTRADAPLLLFAVVLTAFFPGSTTISSRKRLPALLAGLGVAAAGYVLTLSPWLWHNWTTMGALWNPAGTRTLFLRNYDELYSLQAPLSLKSYLAWGYQNILASKLSAGWRNALTLIGALLALYLTPFAGIELWKRRHILLTRLVLWYLLSLYLTMTLLFTFPGPRGSFLHSGTALLPFLMAYAQHGLERAIVWAAGRRGWNTPQALNVLSAGSLLIAVALAFLLTHQALVGGEVLGPGWNEAGRIYINVDAWLDAQELDPQTPVLVGNPPAFYYYTQRWSLAAPNDPPEVVAEACRRFGAEYLILEKDHPRPLHDIYLGRDGRPYFALVETLGPSREVQIYRCQTGSQ